MRRWADEKDAWGPQVNDWYLSQVNKRWRTLGRLAKNPTALMGADKY